MSKNYTVDNDTWASNPGNAKLAPLTWFIHDWKTIVFLCAVLIFSINLTLNLSIWFIFLSIIILTIKVFYWIRKKEHFKSGDSNPGLVIAVNPTLVAVTTDLTKGWGSYPVVKIVKYSTLKNVSLGDKIATVALYTSSGDEEIEHWIDFNPIPLSFATKNEKTIERAMASYDEKQWNDLNQRVKKLKQPYKEGLYIAEIENSNWGSSNRTIA